MHREIKQLARQARRQGWRITRQANSHLTFYPPQAPDTRITASATPSDSRALRNLLADLKRYGFQPQVHTKSGRRRTRHI